MNKENNVNEEPSPPCAFISYSHDSDDHKAWVRDLASSLRDLGIDVILDQWEIGPGDDVPKFMEQSVKKALRVIMVCSEQYVRKADDGKGGAGYEVMVVTGELVADLGTRKFIPIVRQSGAAPNLPACMSTRYYVNFSDDEGFERNLEELARSIHDAPKFEKPPIGSNPFSSPGSEVSASGEESGIVDLVAPFDMYMQSKTLANSGDFAKWRELIHIEKSKAAADMVQWKLDNGLQVPHEDIGLPDYFRPAISTHAGLFAAAFGAFDSSDARFQNQLSLIDTLRFPKGWEQSGSTIFVELPDLVLFTYQALLGGLAMSRHNTEAAYNLATTLLQDRYSRKESKALFKSTWAMGWPESLRHNCVTAWSYLMGTAKEWDWLCKIFGSEEDMKAAIVSYYAFLNTLDFVSASKAIISGDAKEYSVTVPLCFTMVGEEVAGRAKALLYANPQFITEIFADNEIEKEDLPKLWAAWMEGSAKWVADVYRDRVWRHQTVSIFHADLPNLMLPVTASKRLD